MLMYPLTCVQTSLENKRNVFGEKMANSQMCLKQGAEPVKNVVFSSLLCLLDNAYLKPELQASPTKVGDSKDPLFLVGNSLHNFCAASVGLLLFVRKAAWIYLLPLLFKHACQLGFIQVAFSIPEMKLKNQTSTVPPPLPLAIFLGVRSLSAGL